MDRIATGLAGMMSSEFKIHGSADGRPNCKKLMTETAENIIHRVVLKHRLIFQYQVIRSIH